MGSFGVQKGVHWVFVSMKLLHALQMTSPNNLSKWVLSYLIATLRATMKNSAIFLKHPTLISYLYRQKKYKISVSVHCTVRTKKVDKQSEIKQSILDLKSVLFTVKIG